MRLPKTVKYAAKFYDTSQIKALLDCAVGTDIEPIVILSVCYGLRRSEVLGLKWSAIDFVENKIQIDYTITRINTQCEKPRTKNLSSNRTLPLIPYAKNYLMHLKDIQSANAKLFGNCYTQNDFVCKKIDGKPFRTDEVSHKFSRLLKKNGLPHIRLHDLRHSCASMLITDNELKDDLIKSDLEVRYDEHVKKLLANKKTLAWILKYSAVEYKDCTINEIVGFIEGTPEISSVGVDNGFTAQSIKGNPNEDIIR